MGLLDTPWLDGGQPVDDSSSFTKGLRSGVAGLRGQLTAAAGGVMEGLGAPGVARELYRTAEGFGMDAAETAPPVRSYRDVHDLRSAFDYTTGLLGQSAPTVIPAVAGALLTKNPMVGSTLALAAPEAGDVIQRQQADPATAARPVGERNLDALLGGTASAAVQSVVPGMVASKLAGRTAATAAQKTGKELIARSASAIPVEAGAEASGEAIKQAAAGQPLDSQAILEAGVGGAVAGGALGAAGGVGEGLHGAASRAGTSVRETLADAGARAGDAVRAAAGGVQAIAEKGHDAIGGAVDGLFKRGQGREDAIARAVKADDLVDAPDGMKPGDAEAVKASDTKATDWATTKLKGWIDDAGLDQETRAKANDLLGRVADPAARVEVATMALARQASERASDFYTKAQKAFGGAKEAVADSPAAAKVRNMLSSMNSGEGFSVPAFKKAVREMGIEASGKMEDVVARVKAAFDKTNTDDTKKSEDYRGARMIVGRTIMNAIEKTNPELLDNPEDMDRVAEGVRKYVQAAKDGKSPHKIAPVTAYLRMFLGADTIATLDRVYNALHKGTKEENAAFYRDLNAYDEAITGSTKMEDVVRKSLVDKDVDVGDAVDALRRYVRGDHVKQLEGDQRVVREKLLRRELEATFGKDTDKVLAAFEQEYEAGKSESALDTQGEVTDEQGNVVEPEAQDRNLAETDMEPEAPRVYRGKGKAAVPNLAEHRRLYGDTPSQMDRLVERARKENPDRNVSFITARDFEQAYGEKMDVPADVKDADTKYGAVVVEGAKQEGRITEAEARKMLRNDKTPNNSLIGTDKHGITLDAYKITQQSIKGLPYIEGESDLRRIARAFFDGLGSALIAFDAKPDTLNDNLVIAVRNKGKITYGMVKQYKGKGEYSITAENDVESEIKDLKRLMGKQEDEDARKFLLGEIAKLEQKQANTKSISKPYDEVQEVDPTGEVHAAEKAYGDRMGEKLQKEKNAEAGGASTKKTAEPKAKEAAPSEIAEGRTKIEEGEDVIAEAEAILSGETKAATPEQLKTAVKNILDGSTLFDKSIKAFTNTPMRAKMMIRAINDAKISNKRELRNANEAIEKLNAYIEKTLKKSPDVAYSLQLANEAVEVSDKARAHVEKYIKDTLGPAIKVEWNKMMHAGEFTTEDAVNIIRMSVHALDPMGTAYHESLHAFFKGLRKQGLHDVMKVLYRASESAPVMNQMKALLKGQPEAIKQLSDPEERVAHMYQFYAQEKLKLGPDTRNVLQKIKDFIMKVLGMWTNDQRAEHIMEWFHEGHYPETYADTNAVANALMEPGTNKVIERVKKALMPLRRMEQAILSTGAERLRDTENPALVKLAHMIAPETGAEADDVGFVQAYKNESVQRMNALARKLKGISAEDIQGAHAALKRGEKTGANGAQTDVITAVRAYLDETFDYMRGAGVRVRDLGYKADYFPRIWDIDYISKHQDEFIAMLDKIKAAGKWDGNPNAILKNLLSHDGSELGVVVDMPGMQHTKERKLDFIDPASAAPFVEKSLLRSLSSYTTQAARRAEWARRFEDDGSGMRDLLREAKDKHGATQEEIDTAQDFVRSIDGTLGDDISPAMRRVFGNMIVYQNIRLLPLAIFSQVVDPGGILVRGGTFGDAFKAFKRGIMEIPRGFKKNKAKDEWYELAETIGAIDDATLADVLGSSYTQGMVSDGARKWNDALFKFNMVEQFTTSMRVSATEAAVRFLARHGDGKYSEHSERWLAELGLAPGDVTVKDGRILITHDDHLKAGFSEKEALARSNKMKAAVNKWVDGAILRPNAANKPIWMNDPHYALVAHLKQFVYAFQDTILKRAFHEATHGNYGPALALAGYVPMMIAADLVKGMIQGGGEQPQWKKNWGVGQYIHSGIERAGLYGVGQFSTDLLKGNMGSILGPTIEQLGDAVRVIGGNAQFDNVAMKALPANALYSGFLKGDVSAENTAKFTQ